MRYQTSPGGRRTLLLLLAATLTIWVFAIWALRGALALDANALTISRAVPIALLAALVIAGPLVVANLLAEWAVVYTPTAAGLRYESLGVDLLIPWEDVRALSSQPADEPSFATLELMADTAAQIRNPLARWLHTLAHGRARLTIPDTLADRDGLLAAINARAV